MAAQDHVHRVVPVALGGDLRLAVADEADAAGDDVEVGGELECLLGAQVHDLGHHVDLPLLPGVLVEPVGADAVAVQHPRALGHRGARGAQAGDPAAGVEDGVGAAGGGLGPVLLRVEDQFVGGGGAVDAVDLDALAVLGDRGDVGLQFGDLGGTASEHHGRAAGHGLAQQPAADDGRADGLAAQRLVGVDVEEAAVDRDHGLAGLGHRGDGLALGHAGAERGGVRAAERPRVDHDDLDVPGAGGLEPVVAEVVDLDLQPGLLELLGALLGLLLVLERPQADAHHVDGLGGGVGDAGADDLLQAGGLAGRLHLGDPGLGRREHPVVTAARHENGHRVAVGGRAGFHVVQVDALRHGGHRLGRHSTCAQRELGRREPHRLQLRGRGQRGEGERRGHGQAGGEGTSRHELSRGRKSDRTIVARSWSPGQENARNE